METIKYFLKKLFIFALIIGVLIFIFIALQKFVPGLMQKFSFKGGSGTFFTDNWLPDPVNLQKLSEPGIANLDNQVYEGGMTPGMSYVIYGDKGMEIIKAGNKGNPVTTGQSFLVMENPLAVRSLSIYREQSIKTGMVFYGEAKSSFFNSIGTFPVYIFDAQGRAFASEMAVATKQWSTPGWTRFSVKLYANSPPHQSCQIMFAPDKDSPDRNLSYRVTLPVVCN